MGANTGIEWCDATFNPWIGCAKVSPACTHCYAEISPFVRMQRGRGRELWGVNADRHATSDAYWRQPLRWNAEAEQQGIVLRVFCASLADVFEGRADLEPLRARLWDLIASTPSLDWLLLTKRPENITTMVPPLWLLHPPVNVQYGTTAEDQDRWNRRVLEVQLVPAHRRFISVEPMLGEIRTRPSDFTGIHQVIIGGESDNRGKSEARQFVLENARALMVATRAAGAAVFIKQLGSRPWYSGSSGPGQHLPMGVKRLECEGPDGRRGWELLLKDRKGGDIAEWPEDLRVREFPEVRA